MLTTPVSGLSIAVSRSPVISYSWATAECFLDVAWHVSAGLYISVLERPDDIVNIAIPGSIAQGCTDWNAFTSSQVPDQIDSGEKARA